MSGPSFAVRAGNALRTGPARALMSGTEGAWNSTRWLGRAGVMKGRRVSVWMGWHERMEQKMW
jgi:hypothetical protein